LNWYLRVIYDSSGRMVTTEGFQEDAAAYLSVRRVPDGASELFFGPFPDDAALLEHGGEIMRLLEQQPYLDQQRQTGLLDRLGTEYGMSTTFPPALAPRN
jgi:hypothetical protein